MTTEPSDKDLWNACCEILKKEGKPLDVRRLEEAGIKDPYARLIRATDHSHIIRAAFGVGHLKIIELVGGRIP